MPDAREVWAKKAKGLSSTNWLLQKIHGDVSTAIGSVVAKEHA